MQDTGITLSLALASVLFLSLGALATVQAQDPDDQPPTETEHAKPGGGGYFAIGTHLTNLGSLNERLSEAGYPTFASEMISIGGGGYGVAGGRLLLGGEGYGLLSANKGYQGRNVSVGGGYGLFTLGYLLRPEQHLRVYPQVGIGGGGLMLEIGNTGAEDFDDVLNNPNRSATLEKGSLLLSLGVGVEYQFSEPGDESGFQIGLRAGYLLAPYDTSWEIGESSLSSGPDATIGGPFLRLTIGGGGAELDDE